MEQLPNIGNNMKASLERSKTILHRALILRVDTDIEDKDIEEVLTEQGITTSAVSRLRTKEQKATNKVVITLNDEESKKKVLRDGVYLGFSHHRCEPFREKGEGSKIQQCYKCQKWRPGHSAANCENQVKCLWCAGDHAHGICKSFKTKDKGKAKCANCGQDHPAWLSTCVTNASVARVSEDPRVRRVVPSAPSASPEMVTKASLEAIIASVKETVARVVAEVASYVFMKIFNLILGLGNGITSEPQSNSVHKICAKTVELTNASFLTGKPVEGGKIRE
jgi:hypothetical protein